MSTWFLGAALLLALFGGASVVAFEAPTRSAGGLITAFVGVAVAVGALGAPLVPGFVLWVGAGGIGLALLASVLLLNLPEEERGRRSLRFRPSLVVPVLAVLWGALTPPLLEALGATSPSSPVAPAMNGVVTGEAATREAVTSEAVARAVAETFVLPFSVGLVALAMALVVAIALVRRRT